MVSEWETVITYESLSGRKYLRKAAKAAMALVFQYGSNCLESQINSKDRLCGDAKFIGIAETVDDFQLAFDVWSTRRKCAASDIVTSPGNKVWGTLYEVPEFLIERRTAAAQNRKSLDAIEGEGRNYKRETIAARVRRRRRIAKALRPFGQKHDGRVCFGAGKRSYDEPE